MSFKHDFEPTSLREYDIRGIVGQTLHPEDAFAIGRTFGSLVKRDGGDLVVVGYDGRLSSPALEEQLVRGLRASGVHVKRVGRGPTPLLYFGSVAHEADGAIMVTGSHNPPDHNGFKMVMKGKPFFGKQISNLGKLAAAGDVVEEGAHGSVETVDLSENYLKRILQDYDSERPLKVVWDNGNSAAGDVLQRLVAELPGEHTVLYPEIDGTFPNHHPDPTVEANLQDLIAEVRKQGADFGVAFDGDADRIGIVDNKGEILWGDQILAMLARDVLRDNPGATIIADVKASQVLFDEVDRAGGEPLMWKTGHSLIKSKMAETGSPLAGEMSGHIFFADKWFGFDDALYAAVRALGVVSRLPGTVSDMREALPSMVSTPELRFPCADTRKFEVIREVAERLKKAGTDVTEIDGVRVNTPDGWWLLRASNTQAVLVARIEASSPAGLERLKGELVRQLEASGMEAPDFSGAAGH
ncbi:phosphoglucomutase/phosphomannomutase PgmG [Oecophyllibacter saccharovorans]|uniref:phosphoglucomutase/phosphomannomutase PgmG n=1 Tax=Oecophyllibacter saccharovorans TaxID=2558360 RepID=UPI00116DAEFA|nr:phosphomannomutase/phosphoglucomutase [Oecophyllibacter saccharovorans]TPW34804.1 phosphomannomutase/phosphoglucomutase [Oecophyllibacter saccharovorans]